MHRIFIITIGLLLSQSLLARQDISGNWSGILTSALGELQITINLMDDPLSGKLNSSSGISGVELSDLQFDKGQLSFKVPAFGVSYEGKLVGNKITGTWQQGGAEAPLTFSRAKGESQLPTRKQTPNGAEGYTSHNIQFNQSTDGTLLSGTLTLPDGDGSYSSAILLSVAGANDRDQTHSGGHKPFLVMADHLSKNGIAVLRLDDRGVGESEGDLFQCNFETLVHDALSAKQFLADHPKIDASSIGFIGNSEGTVIGAMSAIRDTTVAFTIMLGAVGIPLSDLSIDRLTRMQSMYQLTELQREEIIAYYVALDQIINQDIPKQRKRINIEALKASNTFDKEGFPNHLFFLPASKEERTELYLTRWYKAQLTYHPNDVLPKLTTPSLVINGSLDVFQSPDLNFPAIQKALFKARNTDFTLMVAPQVNHVMQEAKTGLPTEYGKLDNTVSPVVLSTVTNWIQTRFGVKL
ncbi:MAG: hypothetical protein RIF33_04450 [Cyclobacteriaceae bacterium]